MFGGLYLVLRRDAKKILRKNTFKVFDEPPKRKQYIVPGEGIFSVRDKKKVIHNDEAKAFAEELKG